MNDTPKEYILVVYTKCLNGYEETSMIFLDDLPSEFCNNEYYFIDNSTNHHTNDLANKLIDYITTNNPLCKSKIISSLQASHILEILSNLFLLN